MSWIESPWWLLLLPVVARFFAGELQGEDRWDNRRDIPLALASGFVYAGLCSFWLVRFHLARWPLTASDFAQYCQSVAAVQGGSLDTWVPQRSLVAGYLPGALSGELGVLGGLIAGAIASQVLAGASFYVWGRAAHGRVAGVSSMLLGCAVAPLVVLSRTVTFYPEFVATCAFSSAMAMCAVRYRTPASLILGGVGVGLVLLADVRGLYWALANLCIVLVGAIPNYYGHLPRRLLFVLGPVALSWFVGHLLLFPDAPGLDAQTRHFVADALATIPDAPVPELPDYAKQDFLWGRSMPWEVPSALYRLWEVSSYLPKALAGNLEVAHGRETYVWPWIGPAAGALLLWTLRMRRRPATLLGFLLSLAPCVLALWTTSTTLAHPRYLGVAMLGLPVALGVPLGAFVGAPAPPKVAVPLVAVLGLLVLGVVPGFLSPAASWRVPIYAETQPRDFQMNEVEFNAENVLCVKALARDRAIGRDWAPYEYPTPLPEPPRLNPDGDLPDPGVFGDAGAGLAPTRAPDPAAVAAPPAAPPAPEPEPPGGPQGPAEIPVPDVPAPTPPVGEKGPPGENGAPVAPPPGLAPAAP